MIGTTFQDRELHCQDVSQDATGLTKRESAYGWLVTSVSFKILQKSLVTSQLPEALVHGHLHGVEFQTHQELHRENGDEIREGHANGCEHNHQPSSESLGRVPHR